MLDHLKHFMLDKKKKKPKKKNDSGTSSQHIIKSETFSFDRKPQGCRA